MIDPIRNFAKVQLTVGYAAGATEVVLEAGHGARLPAPATEGAFNLVWWNTSDYSDPADDPLKEIVRCTARSTDTLTITRAQEGTSDNAHNESGKTYKMVLSMTKKSGDEIRRLDSASYLKAYQQSTPDLTLLVAKGNVYFGATLVEFAGGNSPSFTAPSSDPRIDILSLNDSGTLTRTAGTEDASPTAPDVPAGNIPICSVYNRVGQTEILDEDDSSEGYIYKDLRGFIFQQPEMDWEGFTATDNLRHSNDAEKTTTSLTYVKLKECLLSEDIDACRIKFDLRGEDAWNKGLAKIYKNGVAIGTERESGTWSTFSEDFTDFEAGDLIQIYANRDGGGDSNIARVQNFRFYWDNSFAVKRIENLELIEPLRTTKHRATDTITNQDP